MDPPRADGQPLTPAPKTADDELREDYYGASLGFAWQRGRTQTALRAFYLLGEVTSFVAGVDPPRL